MNEGVKEGRKENMREVVKEGMREGRESRGSSVSVVAPFGTPSVADGRRLMVDDCTTTRRTFRTPTLLYRFVFQSRICRRRQLHWVDNETPSPGTTYPVPGITA